MPKEEKSEDLHEEQEDSEDEEKFEDFDSEDEELEEIVGESGIRYPIFRRAPSLKINPRTIQNLEADLANVPSTSNGDDEKSPDYSAKAGQPGNYTGKDEYQSMQGKSYEESSGYPEKIREMKQVSSEPSLNSISPRNQFSPSLGMSSPTQGYPVTAQPQDENKKYESPTGGGDMSGDEKRKEERRRW